VDGFRDWDAAYVLGALAPDERRAYELHLEGCESCAAAVAELAGLPGLLSRVEPAAASALLDDAALCDARLDVVPPDAHGATTPPATLLPRLVHSVRRRRRRRVLGSTLGLVAAAAALALAVPLLMPSLVPSTVPLSTPGTTAGSTAVAEAPIVLHQVVSSPLRASARLVPQAWGTRIEMDCRYANQPAGDGYGASGPADYAMYVTDAAGNATQIATWTAGPGQNAEPAGTTSLAADQIASVDVRAVTTGAVLLRANP
jgi:hypothetical protein